MVFVGSIPSLPHHFHSEVSKRPSRIVVRHPLQVRGFAETPVYNPEGLCNDSRRYHRGDMRPIDHPITGALPIVGRPNLSHAQLKEAQHDTPATCQGEQNDDTPWPVCWNRPPQPSPALKKREWSVSLCSKEHYFISWQLQA